MRKVYFVLLLILFSTPVTAQSDSTFIFFEGSQSYLVEVFSTPGTHTYNNPSNVDTVDVLIVAGGGGGGTYGGGGAGGVVFEENLDISSLSSINITVGNGGPGGNSAIGQNGQNSTFANLEALGGGGGGAHNNNPSPTNAQPGGSGGGAGGRDTDPTPGAGLQPGHSTPGFGNAGGSYTTNNRAGGGGGAGSPGETGTGSAAGDGGAGLFYGDKFGSTVGLLGWFGGGGGGGNFENNAPGTGMHGGGNGGYSGSGHTAGQQGTGGGGGGAGQSGNTGANGGSGIVILRYKQNLNYTWTGNINNDWDTPGNWDENEVPVDGAVITIPPTSNDPEISNFAGVRTIEIESGAALTILSDASLVVNSHIINNGTVKVKNDGALIQTSSLNGDDIYTHTQGGVEYTIHAFTTVGNAEFTAPDGISEVDVLIVAGGGGGGDFAYPGGGGAGGLIYEAGVSVSPTTAVFVGNGGTAGENGENSLFASFTAIGGGAGGNRNDQTPGANGGSGGGGGGFDSSSIPGGSGTSGQGNDGGDGSTAGSGEAHAGGGGGGAGTSGDIPVQSGGEVIKGGDGGVGLDYSDFFGTTYGQNGWFAGGGAGGMISDRGAGGAQGGLGGGGNSGQGHEDPGMHGISTSGGGGGGGAGTGAPGSSSDWGLSGSGGSGIVLVRYPSSAATSSPLGLNSGSGTYIVERTGDNDSTKYNGWSAPIANLEVHQNNGIFHESNPCDIFVFDASKQNWSHDFPENYSTSCQGQPVTFTPQFLISNPNGIMDPGQGFFAPGNPTNPTRVFEGSDLNNGNYNITLKTGKNPGSVNWSLNNWNLIGNPYASGINIQKMLELNSNVLLTDAAYVWADDGSEGSSYNENDYIVVNRTGSTGANGQNITNGSISSCQGFFVQAAANDMKFRFTNDFRTADNDQFRSAPDARLNYSRVWIAVDNGEVYNDFLFAFINEASFGFDKKYDAPKRYGQEKLNIATRLNSGEEIAIQAQPHITAKEKRAVPLTVQSGSLKPFEITLRKKTNIDDELGIYIVDSKTNDTLDLRKESVKVEPDSTGYYKDRFILFFEHDGENIDDNDVTSTKEVLADPSDIKVYSSGEEIVIESSQNKINNVRIFTAHGKLIQSATGINTIMHRLNLNNAARGIYIVEVIDVKGLRYTKKVPVTH